MDYEYVVNERAMLRRLVTFWLLVVLWVSFVERECGGEDVS